MGKRSVAVNIGGQRFVVKSDADPTYVRNLASYLDDQMAEIQKPSVRAVSSQKLAVLAALNVADELFQERKRLKEFKRRVRSKSKAVLDYLEKEEKKYCQGE